MAVTWLDSGAWFTKSWVSTEHTVDETQGCAQDSEVRSPQWLLLSCEAAGALPS